MKKEICCCDFCGEEGALTVSIFVYCTRATAEEDNYTTEYIDLCHEHMRAALADILCLNAGTSSIKHVLPAEARRLFISKWRKKQ